MNYDKTALLQAVKESLTDGFTNIHEASEMARDDSIRAPGRMESRYDSSREELGALADSLNNRKAEIASGLASLSGCPLPENPTRVGLGCIALVELIGKGQVLEYFVLPYGGGTRIKGPRDEILVVTPESPIAEAMLGRCIGSRFTTRSQKQYQVKEII